MKTPTRGAPAAHIGGGDKGSYEQSYYGDKHGSYDRDSKDHEGLRGGLFASRDAAFRFAMWENGRRPEAIVWVTGPLELDLSAVGDKKRAESIRKANGFCHYEARKDTSGQANRTSLPLE